jgi:aspartyl-tRNA synthetase
MSFVEQEDIFKVVEEYIFDVVKSLSDKKIVDNKFYRMTHEDSMENY